MDIGGITFPTERTIVPSTEIQKVARQSRLGLTNNYTDEPSRPVTDLTEGLAQRVVGSLTNITSIWATAFGEICIAVTVDGAPCYVTVSSEDQYV
jgi:hypothetical protein